MKVEANYQVPVGSILLVENKIISGSVDVELVDAYVSHTNLWPCIKHYLKRHECIQVF